MKGIYLLLGSNLGNSLQMLAEARSHIENQIGRIIKSSTIYKSEAWGVEEQPDFLNQVVEIETELALDMILENIQSIEKKMGRIRYQKWHSRIIDIDILYAGTIQVNSDLLKVPHPENQNRNFVLVPMVEIAPDFLHPSLLKTQKQLLAESKDPLHVTLLNTN